MPERRAFVRAQHLDEIGQKHVTLRQPDGIIDVRNVIVRSSAQPNGFLGCEGFEFGENRRPSGVGTHQRIHEFEYPWMTPDRGDDSPAFLWCDAAQPT